jgi:hypothetical protein
MAVVIKRIEKNILLKSLFNKDIPIKYITSRREYSLVLQSIADDKITYTIIAAESSASKSPDADKADFIIRKKLDCIFIIDNVRYSFSPVVISLNSNTLVTTNPQQLYQDLQRSYYRILPPVSMKIILRQSGWIYDLDYPAIDTVDDVSETVTNNFDGDGEKLKDEADKKLQAIKDSVDSYELLLYKDNTPKRVEEKLIANTGKVLFVSNEINGFVETLRDTNKHFIDKDAFSRYLLSTGVTEQFLDSAIQRFIVKRREQLIVADAYVPVMFHQYILGCIHACINEGSNKKFDIAACENIFETGKLFAASLEARGYFNEGKHPDKPFSSLLVDTSASGFKIRMFREHPSARLQPGTALDVLIRLPARNSLMSAQSLAGQEAPVRKIRAQARVVRKTTDVVNVTFGCKFTKIEGEDLRFMFESIYGKPFMDSPDSIHEFPLVMASV